MKYILALMLLPVLCVAQVSNIRQDKNGNVLNTTPSNFPTGGLRVNGITVLGGGGGGGGDISDTAFGSAWNNVTTIGPSQNSLYDYFHQFIPSDNGKVGVLNVGAGVTGTNASGVVGAVTIGSGLTFTPGAPVGTLAATGGGGSIKPIYTVNVKDAPYSATGDGVTDDSAAIQAAITAVWNQGGGTVFFPANVSGTGGTYLCNGAFDGITNSVLKIPYNAQANTPIAITLMGESGIPWFSGSGSVERSGAIIKCTKTGTGVQPAILAGAAFNGSPAIPDFNYTYLYIRDLTFRTYDNPSINALRLETVVGVELNGVRVDTLPQPPVNQPPSQPTHATTAIWFPLINDGPLNRADNVTVVGFDRGCKIGEHFHAPWAFASYCNVGFEFFGVNEGSEGNLGTFWCPTSIGFAGAHAVDLFLDAERASTGAWYSPVQDILDSSNFGTGIIRYNIVAAGAGPVSPATITGGAKLKTIDLQNSVGESGDLLSVLASPEVSITTGTTLTSSAFGKMHVCTGTTADYTVGLPAVSGNAGKFIGFRMATALTKRVTLDGNASETIDGALTRIMWSKESAVLLCNGTEWIKVAGKSIPMICNLSQATGNQSLTTATLTKITVDTIVDDSVGMADLTNKRINIKRPGTYLFNGAVSFNNISADSVRILTQLAVTGVGFANAETFGKTNGFPTAFATRSKTGLLTTDYVELNGFQQSGVNQSTDGVDAVTFLGASEIPTW